MSAGVARAVTGEWVVTPVTIGPTWMRNPDWDGSSPLDEFVLPEITLGWQVLTWVADNLLGEETDEFGKAKPFRATPEQQRFILWWYAIDESGRFIYREGILQRLKGWGKDPLAAVISAVEFVGPCRFAGWATGDMPDLGLERGDPVGRAHPRAWIQIAAVSKEQTKNTMTIFPGLFSKECRATHSIDIGKEVIYAYNGQRRIEALTSSPATLEGARPTLVIKNETHHWKANNEGHAMADVIERNATKSKDGAARSLSITNAYDPSENSVAQIEREAWEEERDGLAIATGVLYDSLEAPEEAAMLPPRAQGAPESSEAEIRDYLGAIVRAVRGDASWLDVDGIVNSILSRKNPPSRSRRFWFNQIQATEDAWLEPAAARFAADTLALATRRDTADPLRAGWLVLPEEPIVVFFDGSKSDDATALVGCRLSDGYVFTLGVWQRPPKSRAEGWQVPRHEVDNRVEEVFARFSVIAFWGDPSHALDDDSIRYWDGLIDDWHRRFKDRLLYWAVKTGDRAHSIMWDMTSSERQTLFIAEAERFVAELEHKINEGEEDERYDPAFLHDGHPALLNHLGNAKRFPVPGKGVSLWKGHRESARKIDLAVAAVGARMLRRFVLNKGVEEKKDTPGTVWHSHTKRGAATMTRTR